MTTRARSRNVVPPNTYHTPTRTRFFDAFDVRSSGQPLITFCQQNKDEEWCPSQPTASRWLKQRAETPSGQTAERPKRQARRGRKKMDLDHMVEQMAAGPRHPTKKDYKRIGEQNGVSAATLRRRMKERRKIPDFILQKLPSTPVCTGALSRAMQILPEAILNHSIRVYLLSRWLAVREGSEWSLPVNLPLLFVACICHDFGASNDYNGHQRFEVEGADAAVEHLRHHSCNPADQHKVWVAIALHTSAGIAERIDPLTRLVRLGVKTDFSAAIRESLGAIQYAGEIETYLPRLGVEKVLADAVVKQATKIPERVDRLTWPDSEKHPKASWPGMLLRAHLLNPDHEGVNPAF